MNGTVHEIGTGIESKSFELTLIGRGANSEP